MSDKNKILVVLSRFPYPLEKGDKLRAFYQLKELSEKYSITLFCTHDKKITDTQLKAVSKYCDKFITQRITWWSIFWNIVFAFIRKQPLQVGYFYSLQGTKKIKQELKLNKHKHIYCQLIRSSELVKNIHSIPKTLDYMDALSTGVQRRVQSQPFYLKWIFRREAELLRKYEQEIFDYFENRTIISDQDKKLINHQDREKIIVIPNGVDKMFFEESENTMITHDLVFVGNMSYPPNIEAVKYIQEHILTESPGLTLLVSGSNPHASIRKLAENDSRITLTGWVDDIRESYRRGKIFLAPMTIGTGMQNKLLEAMALGVPCITTSLANNALKAEPGKDILVGETPEEINSLIHKLLNDNELRNSLTQNARNFVAENYSWKTTTSILIERIEQDFN